MHGIAQVALPYSQDFEATSFPPLGWQTFPIGSSTNWILDNTVSGYGIGSACISFDNYNTVAGTYFGIRLPAMDFTNISDPYIRFDVAYAQRIGTGSDVFGFWWSNNGSSNWQNIINYSGSNLSTAPSTSNLFVPTPGQWQTKTLSISTLAGLPFVRLAIEDDCNHGNKIYIDNIIVFDSTTNVGINENNSYDQAMIYPNPTNDKFYIKGISSYPINVALINSLGEKLFESEIYDITNSINVAKYKTGLYYYELRNKGESVKQGKLIIQ